MAEDLDILLLFSKIIGYAIVFGSAMVKIPQIQLILKTKTSEGVSLQSAVIETIGFSISLAYSVNRGFPFSTWGEFSFMTIQNYILFFLIIRYSPTKFENLNLMGAGFVIYLAVFSAALFGLLGSNVIMGLQQLTIPVMVASKLPQIWKSYKASGTGSVSLITWTLNFGGSGARIFTTWKEVDDRVLLFSYLLSCSLNGIIWAQIVYYNYVVKPKPKPKAA